jgi:hypothetical protein
LDAYLQKLQAKERTKERIKERNYRGPKRKDKKDARNKQPRS